MATNRRPVARTSLSDFLSNQVYPALADKLDKAFHEFGFQACADRWVATRWPPDFMPEVTTKSPGRVQAYRNSPWGFHVHGRRSFRWLDYISGFQLLRGAAFIDSVSKLAAAAGVAIPRRNATDEESTETMSLIRRQDLLEIAISEAEAELHDEAGESARAYLSERGVDTDCAREFRLGLFSAPVLGRVRTRWMEECGDSEVLKNAGLGGLIGYITVPWFEAYGLPLTIYGRWPGTPPGRKKKTHALPGSLTKSYPLFFDRALKHGVSEIVAVEGLFDALIAQARGDHRVVAYVGASIPKAQAKALATAGVTRVILCGDPDSGGDTGTATNVEILRSHQIAAYVAPRLPENTDPDQFILASGIEAWRTHVNDAVRGLTWSVSLQLDQLVACASALDRDSVLVDVAKLLQGRSGPDFEEALKIAADRSGLSPQALQAMAPAPALRPNQRLDPPIGRPKDDKDLDCGVDFGGSMVDTANAKVLATLHAPKMKFVLTWNRWILWDGKRWQIDGSSSALAMGRCAAVADWYRLHASKAAKEASDINTGGEMTEEQIRLVQGLAAKSQHFMKQAKKADSADGRSSMLKIAASMPEFQIRSHEDLDTDKWLLNAGSGIIDLRTGYLHEHDPNRYMTRIAAVDYQASAQAPKFEQFMSEVFPDEEVRGFVRRVVGCALIGAQVEEVVLFFYGSGSNGKSTFIGIIESILGGYACAVRPDFFDVHQRSEHATEIAALYKARVTVCSEPKEDARWDESKVKTMTGNDKRYARCMRQDAWYYTPTDTIIVHGNHRPLIKGVSDGIWRRLVLIPFTAKFKAGHDQESKTTAEAKPAQSRLGSMLVAEEGPGILAYFVKGCIEYLAQGLAMPASIRGPIDAFRMESDDIGQFLDECFDLVDPECARMGALELYEQYAQWMKATGRAPTLSMVRFAARLTEREIPKVKDRNGAFYLGIASKEARL